MQIDLKCTSCGGNRFDYPIKLEDSSVIACADCGHEVGTVTEIQQKVVQRLSQQNELAAHHFP